MAVHNRISPEYLENRATWGPNGNNQTGLGSICPLERVISFPVRQNPHHSLLWPPRLRPKAAELKTKDDCTEKP